MATLFTRIIQGELPGRFVYRDDLAVAFLSIHPMKPGHTLVVPRAEVDHWLDLEPQLAQHLFSVAREVGRGLDRAFQPARVGLMVAGLEVPHVHIHLVPIWAVNDLDFANQDTHARPEDLDAAADQIRSALRKLGCAHVA
ncbi:MAG: HIT family protein [Candidatus Eremiobacterota bacterium]